MDISLKGKVAIVTGASLGIGKGIAKSYALHGAEVIICARGLKRLNEVAEDIEAVPVKKYGQFLAMSPKRVMCRGVGFKGD